MTKIASTVRRTITIRNAHGLHARPAARFVEASSRYQSDIFVYKDQDKVNGKSIMGLLTLAAGCGVQLELEAIGHDAQQALDDLCQLADASFGFEEA